MEQPPGHVAQGETKICRLKKDIMDSSRVQGRGLKSSALPFFVLVFTDVTQITMSSFGAQSMAS